MSLAVQHAETWSRWSTAVEDHTWCHSSLLRTRNWNYISHRFTKSCVMPWGIFSWDTLGPLAPTAKFKCHSLQEHCSKPHSSLYDHSASIFRWCFQQDAQSSKWPLEKNKLTVIKMVSMVTGSQSKRETSGYGATGDLHHQICINCMMLSCQYEPDSQRNVFSIVEPIVIVSW